MDVLFAHVERPPPPLSQWTTLEPRLERIILRCLKKDPALRPQSAKQLQEEISPILSETRGSLPARRNPGGGTASSVDMATEPPTLEPPHPIDVSFDTEANTAAQSMTEPGRRPRAPLLIGLTIVVAALAGLAFWSFDHVQSQKGAAAAGAPASPSAASSSYARPQEAKPSSKPPRPTVAVPHAAQRPSSQMKIAPDTPVDLELRSTPAGAAVYLGDTKIATTPATVTLSASTDPTPVRFVFDGETTVVKRIRIDRPQTLNVTLASPPRPPRFRGANGGGAQAKSRKRKRSRPPVDLTEFKLRR
jgi:serine/threonine protein kinase